MSISYKKTVALLEGHCEIEEAEGLLAWLLEHPKGKVNLRNLQHLHTAVLQVVMAVQPEISSPPADESVARWLMPALQ